MKNETTRQTGCGRWLCVAVMMSIGVSVAAQTLEERVAMLERQNREMREKMRETDGKQAKTETKGKYMPQLHGILRGKYEYQPEMEASRFEVRNARLSVGGALPLRSEYKLEVETLHGDNREMADAVNNIGEGIRNAVRTSMKDEQMKTDLITNVSHDIKTPLTSIVNYVDLLKRMKIQDEQARNYIDILDGKAQRLKQLTDDLVEASKISSGNIELNWEKINLSELLNQAIGEFSDKFEHKQLTVILDVGDKAANVLADSRRMWRIIENLFNNICKYAMETTRVYVDLTVEDGVIEVFMKNISERQMNIKSDELTERFIRGDSSRTTEGSGLGLYIAKSLTQVQQGEFRLELDGDLFKVVLRFPEYVEKVNEVTLEQNEQ